jgi:glycosyltransferase involved in cell wall biosynthesis
VDRWSDRGGAYHHLAGVLDLERRAGLEAAVAAGVQDAPGSAIHVVPGLESRTRAHAALGRLVESFHPDVVHLHTVVNPEVLEWAAGRASVITVQDHRYFCPTRGKWTLAGHVCNEAMRSGVCAPCFEDAAYFREVYALTEERLAAVGHMRAVVALSEYMAAELRRAGVPAANITVIPPFVHRLRREGASGPPCVVVVGRLTEAKGVRDALAAWRRSGTDLPLIALGTGPLRSWLEDEGVRVTGWLDRTALATHLGRARALLLTPRWQEPFGIAGLEALTLGVPVVAWQSGGIGEWHPGPLAAWGDVEAVAERLRVVVSQGFVPEEEQRRPRPLPSPEGSMALLARVYERAVGLP